MQSCACTASPTARQKGDVAVVVEAARDVRAHDPVLDREIAELQRLEDVLVRHATPPRTELRHDAPAEGRSARRDSHTWEVGGR